MPEPPIQTLGEKTYKVVGPHAVFGAKTGETLTLDLTEQQEQFYVVGGHLKVVTAKKQKEEKPNG